MTRQEAEDLVRDLLAAGIEVQRVDELDDGTFAPYYHVTQPYDHCAWVTRPTLFRENVRAGLIEGIARDAL